MSVYDLIKGNGLDYVSMPLQRGNVLGLREGRVLTANESGLRMVVYDGFTPISDRSVPWEMKLLHRQSDVEDEKEVVMKYSEDMTITSDSSDFYSMKAIHMLRGSLNPILESGDEAELGEYMKNLVEPLESKYGSLDQVPRGIEDYGIARVVSLLLEHL